MSSEKSRKRSASEIMPSLGLKIIQKMYPLLSASRQGDGKAVISGNNKWWGKLSKLLQKYNNGKFAEITVIDQTAKRWGNRINSCGECVSSDSSRIFREVSGKHWMIMKRNFKQNTAYCSMLGACDILSQHRKDLPWTQACITSKTSVAWVRKTYGQLKDIQEFERIQMIFISAWLFCRAETLQVMK